MKLSELRNDRKARESKVINTDHVFRIFRLFQKDFTGRPAHLQRDLLQSAISRIVVQEEGIRVFYYGSPREDRLLSSSKEEIEAKVFGGIVASAASDSQRDSTNKKTPP